MSFQSTSTVKGRTAIPQEATAPTSLAALPSDIVVRIFEKASRNDYLFFLNLSRVCTLFHQHARQQVAPSYFSSLCDSLHPGSQDQPQKPFIDLLAKLRDRHLQLTTQDISALLMGIADQALLLADRYLVYDCLEALGQIAAILPEQEREICRTGIEDAGHRFAAQKTDDCRMVRSMRRALWRQGRLDGNAGASCFDILFQDQHGATLPKWLVPQATVRLAQDDD